LGQLISWGLDQYEQSQADPLGYNIQLSTNLLVGAAMVATEPVPLARGYNPSLTTKESISALGTLNVAAKGVTQAELKFGQQQVWKKFGEHYKEFGLTHSQEGMQEYLRIAQEVHRNPILKHTFPQTGYYRGETWMINNGRLLRLDPEGKFRTLYMLK